MKTMRKCLFFLVLSLEGFARTGQMPPPPHQTLVVGFDQHLPPYEYVDHQGHPAGLALDVIREVAQEAGISLQFRPGTWAQVRGMLGTGEVDLCPGMFYSSQRAEQLDFSIPYQVVTYQVFVRAGNPMQVAPAHLGPFRVGVEEGDIIHDTLRPSLSRLQTFPNIGAALHALRHGELDAVVAPKVAGVHALNATGIRGVAMLQGSYWPQKYCIALRKGHSELLARINEALFILKGRGTLDALTAKHLAPLEAQSVPIPVLLRRLSWIILSVTMLVVGITIWAAHLRRKVRQRTRSLSEELQARHMTERALRRSEEKYRILTEHSQDLVSEWDSQGRHTFLNANFNRVLGLPASAFMQRTLLDIEAIPEDERRQLADQWPSKFEPGTELRFTFSMQGAEGTLRVFDCKAHAFLGEEGELRVSAISRDITAPRKMEEAMRQAQRLESIGLLAGGVAHDFNNILAALQGNLGLLDMAVPLTSPGRSAFERMDRALQRATELTRQLLAYAGRGRYVMEPRDLASTVRDMASILRVTLSKRIQIDLEAARDTPTICADGGQLQQVILNLITNASDAIGGTEGLIKVRTGRLQLEKTQLETEFPAQPLPPGTYAFLEVRDTGCGMSPEVLARIFDPFFSTKGSGRGLGLSAILGILKGHRGGFRIHSVPGHGTAFQVIFPAVDAPCPVPQSQVSLEHPVLGSTLLVVDDEPDLLDALAEGLRASGFRVLKARDGREALATHEAARGRIDLVLMDLIMPNLGGAEAAVELHRRDPGLPILLCSGYGEEPCLEALQHVPHRFLQKPCSIRTLERTVVDMLARTSEAPSDAEATNATR